jgi:putative transposase
VVHLNVEFSLFTLSEKENEMKRSRFSEEQIIGILAEQESGMKVSEVCRKHGMSDATFYKWKSQFGGMTVSEAKRLKGLESENTELKKMVAELSLDKRALEAALRKKY